jgi:hypothetical protein
MKHRPRASKTPCIFSQSLQRRLNMYALAASAAGVSLLTLAQPSEAKVIHKKAHQVIGTNGTYNLDLNHDGIVDFIIHEWGSVPLSDSLLTKEALGNSVQGRGNGGSEFESALRPGAWIGPSQGFIQGWSNGERMVLVNHNTYTGKTYVSGPWVNVKNRYLGLRFQIHGKTHYGWARLSVRVGGVGPVITAKLTGYAYETVPDRRLRAGSTESETNSVALPISANPARSVPATLVAVPASDALGIASLALLALGAAGIAVWRRP